PTRRSSDLLFHRSTEMGALASPSSCYRGNMATRVFLLKHHLLAVTQRVITLLLTFDVHDVSDDRWRSSRDCHTSSSYTRPRRGFSRCRSRSTGRPRCGTP